MESYCLKCKNKKKYRKHRQKFRVLVMVLSKCVICGSKKSRFIKNQEKGLLSKLGIKTPLSKMPILGDILL